MSVVEVVEGFEIGYALRFSDDNRRVFVFEEHEVDKESADSAVAVFEWVDVFKLSVQERCELYRVMLCFVFIERSHNLFHFFFYPLWVNGFDVSTNNHVGERFVANLDLQILHEQFVEFDDTFVGDGEFVLHEEFGDGS